MEWKTAIGVRKVEFVEMTIEEFNAQYNRSDSPRDGESSNGYAVKYYDGFISWASKESFEYTFLEIKGCGTKILGETVEEFLGEVVSQQIDDKTTFVTAETLIGFRTHGISQCVTSENYDHDKGSSLAKEKIKSDIWKCLGFVLHWATRGIKR